MIWENYQFILQKKELEELFEKKIIKKSKAFNCFCCNKDIIEDCRKDKNIM